jgi:hypothetical protein
VVVFSIKTPEILDIHGQLSPTSRIFFLSLFAFSKVGIVGIISVLTLCGLALHLNLSPPHDRDNGPEDCKIFPFNSVDQHGITRHSSQRGARDICKLNIWYDPVRVDFSRTT